MSRLLKELAMRRECPHNKVVNAMDWGEYPWTDTGPCMQWELLTRLLTDNGKDNEWWCKCPACGAQICVFCEKEGEKKKRRAGTQTIHAGDAEKAPA